MRYHVALPLAASLLITGCSWISSYLRGSDNTQPPAELIPVDQPIAIQNLWDTDVESGTEGAFIKLVPAIDGGRVYAAGREGDIEALDAANGQNIWTVETELPISAGVGLGEEILLVGTSDGEILALRRDDGKEAWRARVSSEILATPKSAEGVVVVRTIDGAFTGLDARTGQQLWVYTYRVPVLTLRGTAPPLLARGLAFVGLDNGKLLILSLKNGAPVFEKTIAPPRGRTEIDRMVDIDAPPRVVGETLYVAGYQGTITAIDLRGGRTVWTRDFSSHSGVDADDRAVYVTDDTDTVWALDRLNGQTLWKQAQLKGRRLSAPVVNGEYLLVGDFEGYLHWLARADGRVVGRVRADKKGIAAAPVVQDDVVYVLGEGGRLSAYRPGTG